MENVKEEEKILRPYGWLRLEHFKTERFEVFRVKELGKRVYWVDNDDRIVSPAKIVQMLRRKGWEAKLKEDNEIAVYEGKKGKGEIELSLWYY